MNYKRLIVILLFIPGILSIGYLISDRYALSWIDETADNRLGKQVLIPEGDYYVGSDNASEDEQPLRIMHFKSYFIDIHPVTNTQYIEFLLKSHYTPEGPFDQNNALKNPYLPAVNITYKDAFSYAQFFGMRLPAEWEWEAAARSLKKENRFVWGSFPALNKCNCFSDAKDAQSITPVFQFPPNELGLYDMAGNVFEWTSSLYPSNYLLGNNYSQYTLLVLRGGAWTNIVTDLTVSSRTPFASTRYLPWLGFRCVKDAQK